MSEQTFGKIIVCQSDDGLTREDVWFEGIHRMPLPGSARAAVWSRQIDHLPPPEKYLCGGRIDQGFSYCKLRNNCGGWENLSSGR